MLEVLNRKIRQMHAALGALSSNNIHCVSPTIETTATYTFINVDFNQGSDPVELSNMASLLIANIASIKDHLKAWCKSKSIPFKGDTLINNNRSVALIHDLWNVDKHAELNSKPRSGYIPKLTNLSKALSLSTGTEAGASVIYQLDPLTGQMEVKTTASGSAKIQLSGTIVDEVGNTLADFHTTCNEAVAAWESELVAAGAPMP